MAMHSLHSESKLDSQKFTMETPTTSHITFDDYKHVYEPAEDTFFLIDVIESELPHIRKRNPSVCLEIGTGSGVVITALSKTLQSSVVCFGVDINEHACRISKQTSLKNATNVEMCRSDLLDAFKRKSIDILLFNPPYVVTENEEISNRNSGVEFNDNIIKSWAGGLNGRQIMDKVFVELDNLLAVDGVAYVLVIKDNKPDEIIEDLVRLKMKAVAIGDRKIRGEHLFVLKIERQ
ncbi:methyltransferase N6AMT1-like isoform X2 [Bradysia coprophila]|uniref:methyltransferase N6AMT1-like isoform X2 n=1 Tax=Bradysia coprophila TaxID=38358 RepID=UPI00187DCC2A|nr:methyltransferase N6AMT1-like isoform X2 [Bradysia coprophila]